jgi:translation initiation factor IF-2
MPPCSLYCTCPIIHLRARRCITSPGAAAMPDGAYVLRPGPNRPAQPGRARAVPGLRVAWAEETPRRSKETRKRLRVRSAPGSGRLNSRPSARQPLPPPQTTLTAPALPPVPARGRRGARRAMVGTGAATPAPGRPASAPAGPNWTAAGEPLRRRWAARAAAAAAAAAVAAASRNTARRRYSGLGGGPGSPRGLGGGPGSPSPGAGRGGRRGRGGGWRTCGRGPRAGPGGGGRPRAASPWPAGGGGGWVGGGGTGPGRGGEREDLGVALAWLGQSSEAQATGLTRSQLPYWWNRHL